MIANRRTLLAKRTSLGVLCPVFAVCLVTVCMLPDSVFGGGLFPRDSILLPFVPAAAVEGPSSLRFNPAGLYHDQGFAINYYHTYSETSAKGDDGLYVSAKGLGFAVERLGSGVIPDGRSYTVGLSTGTGQGFNIGSTYQWRSSDDSLQDKSHFWSHGATWRPGGPLSLAAAVDNYNRMKLDSTRSDREFVYSAALNLFDGRVMVGGDWYQTSGQRFQDGTYRLAAAVEVTSGITAFTDINKDTDFFFGLRMDLADVFVGSHASFDRNGGYRGGVFYAGHSATRRPSAMRLPREVLKLHISGAVPDRKPAKVLFAPTPLTSFEWIGLLEKAAGDPNITAVVLTMESPQLGGARIEELRRALSRVRAVGKYVVVYADGMVGNSEYYLATAADQIVVPPVATIDLVGLRAEVTFVKRLLDKLGIKADLEHTGDYKTASDLLTRTSMSEAHRDALNRLLDDLDGFWVGELAVGRGATSARVREWIDHGPFISTDAQTFGLIDTVAYEDELEGLVRAAVGRIDRTTSGRALRQRKYKAKHWGPPPTVAVVFASGSIVEGEDRDNGLMGPVMGSHSVGQALREARSDHSVDAVVLRVNSGGGSVFASEEILREASRVAEEKPLVVSFGDVAASGGYYIAGAADSVFALPNTITGSIGVISGKLDLSGLYDKIGFDKEVLTRGRYADIYGTTRSFDDDERDIVRFQMTQAYNRFVGLVAEGRNLTADSVDAIGQGRVWSGLAAKDLGLVDRFADLPESIAVAAKMAGVKAGRSVRVRVLPRQRRRLFDMGWLGNFAGAWGTGSVTEGVEAILGLNGPISGGARYELPYTITVR